MWSTPDFSTLKSAWSSPPLFPIFPSNFFFFGSLSQSRPFSLPHLSVLSFIQSFLSDLIGYIIYPMSLQPVYTAYWVRVATSPNSQLATLVITHPSASRYTYSKMWSCNLFFIILPLSCPVLEIKLIPLWFTHFLVSPFLKIDSCSFFRWNITFIFRCSLWMNFYSIYFSSSYSETLGVVLTHQAMQKRLHI